MVRSMFKAKNLLKTFWAEVVCCVCYILNWSPTRTVWGMIPEEAWRGYKPHVGHFGIFGCISYSHILDVLRKKLDDKEVRCIFVSYSEESKAYKLYNLETKNLVISRGVKFLEDQEWCWKLQENHQEVNILGEAVSQQ